MPHNHKTKGRVGEHNHKTRGRVGKVGASTSPLTFGRYEYEIGLKGLEI